MLENINKKSYCSLKMLKTPTGYNASNFLVIHGVEIPYQELIVGVLAQVGEQQAFNLPKPDQRQTSAKN